MKRLGWLLPLVLLAGCGAGPTKPEPLRVAAASDLQAVMPILASRFKADTGIDVEASFGASGQFAAQIRQGAPFDLFLAANRAFVDDLAESGAVRPDSVRPYARGALVLVVNRLFDPGLKGPDDLVGDKVKTIGDRQPRHRPLRRARRSSSWSRSGLWERAKPKITQAGSCPPGRWSSSSLGTRRSGFVGKAISFDVKAGARDPACRPTDMTRSSRRWGSSPIRSGSSRPGSSPGSCSARRGRGS